MVALIKKEIEKVSFNEISLIMEFIEMNYSPSEMKIDLLKALKEEKAVRVLKIFTTNA